MRRETFSEYKKGAAAATGACKETGAQTILLLENGDMALTNHWVVYEAVVATLADRTDRPDEVWLVDTCIEENWTVLCLIRDGQGFPDEHRYWDYDPTELEAVG